MSAKYAKTLIVTPIRGNQTQTLYTAGIMQSVGIYGAWLPLAGQSDVYVARNVLANEFVNRKEFDTLVWIDSDIGFTRQNLQTLVDTTEPIVSGLYTDKCQPPMPFCRGNDGQSLPLDEIPKDGMIPVRFMPGGFLKVERIVLQSIIDQNLVQSYGQGKFHHFYNGRIALDNLLSEDYSFSELVREAGFQGWMHCGVRLSHDGRTVENPPPAPPQDTIVVATPTSIAAPAVTVSST